MSEFLSPSILKALAGGALIGLAASMSLFFAGRVAGISGITAGLVLPKPGDWTWRMWFVAGLFAGAAVLLVLAPEVIQGPSNRSTAALAVAGLLVGFGTRLGSGCTSGHGVCGLSRFSGRSLVATCTFMATGFAIATGIRLLVGGGSV